MDNIKVSVILPSLNVVQYIKEAVESVINQTLKDIEIICVDAGSTDGTLEILKEYATKDKRVKLLISDKKSYGYQMNLGMDNASGEYIGIVETDDYVPEYMYEELYKAAKENDVDFIKADFYRFTGEGENISKAYFRLTDDPTYYNRIIDISEEQEVFRFPMNTWSGIYKREFLQKHNIRHNETPGASYQDNGFWFQTFMYAKRAFFIDKPYYMNRRDNPNSSVYSKAKIYCICDEYDFIYNIIKKDQETYQKFKFTYSTICYQNYKFNLERIADEYKPEFLQRFRDDFIQMRDRGELDRSLIGTMDWEMLTYIMQDPLEFYEKELKLRKKIYDQISEYNQVIIYGAGVVGRKVLYDLTYKDKPVNVICFAVSNKKDNVDEYHGYKIREIKELDQYTKSAAVVVATTEKHHASIINTLKELKFEHIIPIPEFGRENTNLDNLILDRYAFELKKWYERTTGKKLNLDNPLTFNEKIQWLKLYDCSDKKAKLLDKYAVREWIKSKLGEEYLVPLLGVYDKFDDINFEELPRQFVIKATHGAGFNHFVSNKDDEKFNTAILKRKFDEWLNTNYAYCNGFDLSYKNIKPKIIIEALVEGKIRHSNYKILCFYGEPVFIIVDTNKEKYGRNNRDIFDINWNHLNFSIKYPNALQTPEKPDRLSDILNLTRTLAGNYKFIRIDWFVTKDKILFNQVKFSPGNGVEYFSDPAYDVKLGELLKL